MKRLVLTHHTVRCPLEDCAASLTVRTDPGAAPSRRHRDVAACSLLPSTPIVPSSGRGLFADPPVAYLSHVDCSPRHSTDVACAKDCLEILNAAEPGASEPIRCTSGVSDALELARQVQSPGVMRVIWLHSV